MRRREFVGLIGGAVVWPLAAPAQQTGPVRSVGWVVTGSPDTYRNSLSAFREGLKSSGLIEGENLTIEYRWAEGISSRLPELAESLVQQRVEVILAGGTAGALAAKNATETIPIVAAGAGDLVEVGLVRNLTSPEGNLTGFLAIATETVGKRIDLARELLPDAKRLKILWNPNDRNARREMDVLRGYSRTDIEFDFFSAGTATELTGVLSTLGDPRLSCVMVLNDPFMFSHRAAIVTAVARARFPGVYGYREYTDDGGLISYGASISGTYRRAAEYVAKLLRGAKTADLPVQAPTTFELVVNARAAFAAGFTVPQTILARADEVIE